MAKFDESNKVSTEDMEQIAGGTSKETAADSRFLHELLRDNPDYQPHIYNARQVANVWRYVKDIVGAWKSVGVICEASCGVASHLEKSNSYYIDNKEVSRQEAINHAMEVVGKTITGNW